MMVFLLLFALSTPRIFGIKLVANCSLDLSGFQKRLNCLFKNRPLEDVIIEEIQDSIKEFFTTQGFPFASTEILKFSGTKDSLWAFIKINPGSFIVIRKIQLIGLKRTRKWVVLKYLNVLKGTPFNSRKLKNALSRIETEFPIQFKKFEVDSSGILRLFFKEKDSGYISGNAGYSREGGWIGELEISIQNLLGYGENFNLTLKRIGNRNENMQFRAAQKILFTPKTKLNILENAEIETRYRDYQKIVLSVLFGPQLLHLKSFMGIKRLEIKDFANNKHQVNMRGLGQFIFKKAFKSKYHAHFSFTLEFSNELKKSKIYLGFSKSYSFIKIGLSLRNFNILTKNRVSRWDLWKSSGLDYLLGYKREQILFKSAKLFQAKILLLLKRKTGIFLKFEYGPVKSENSNFITYGYGFGIKSKTLETFIAWHRGLPLKDGVFFASYTLLF